MVPTGMKWRRADEDPPRVGQMVAAFKPSESSQVDPMGFVFRVSAQLLTSMRDGELWVEVPEPTSVEPLQNREIGNGWQPMSTLPEGDVLVWSRGVGPRVRNIKGTYAEGSPHFYGWKPIGPGPFDEAPS